MGDLPICFPETKTNLHHEGKKKFVSKKKTFGFYYTPEN